MKKIKKGKQQIVARKRNFFKGAVRFYAINIRELICELFPHYTFLRNWEICSTDEMEEVLHIYKYWMGVEISHEEYVLKCSSLSSEEQQNMIREHMYLLRRMYKELPKELQKEVVR